jgi:hypothetical protein
MDTTGLSRHDVSRLITVFLRVIRETARVSELVALLVSPFLASREYKRGLHCTFQPASLHALLHFRFPVVTPHRWRVMVDGRDRLRFRFLPRACAV